MRLRLLLAVALPLAAAACLTPGECRQSGVPGVQVALRDRDGNAIADSAVAVLEDVTYRDTMFINQYENGHALVLAGAIDRAGTYSICIHRNTQADFHRDGIPVLATACGISPQNLQVFMTPLTDTSTVCS